MADAQTKQQDRLAPVKDLRATPNVHPDEVARRELVEWCKAHGLPVPPERGNRR